MSSVVVSDKRGGVYQVQVTFTYGECDRLPYNALRKVKARIEQVNNGGIMATAEFNIRNAQDASHFVQVLDFFGEDGSFVHGSSADPEILNLEAPPEDEDTSGIRSVTSQKASSAKKGSNSTKTSPKQAKESAPSQEEAEDLEVESEAEGLEAEPEENEAETEVDGDK